ncbi:MAG TPA: hypothetical protein PKK06_17000 [Phycisphaerae bacterium]|nr:hypothetical protein [Phycisphaerae bacterium]HNU46228.1 hypothetical protein [Phycisphaerae bacterium]
MTTDAQQALQQETEFLSGMESQLRGAQGRLLRGTHWELARHDESDELRQLMAQRGLYDRELLKRLPVNRRVALHGYERRLWFWRRRTGVAVASTLSPLAHYVSGSGGIAPPVSLAELKDHVRKLVGAPQVPHLIGVCSPSGFTAEARSTRLGLPNAQVVLIEPDGHGGWRVASNEPGVSTKVLELFDPEDTRHKVARVRALIAQRSADLLTGSLSAAALAAELDLPELLVRQAFEEATRAEPELKFSRYEGDVLLYRGASVEAQETRSMGVIERIKQLFSREGHEAEKINLLMQRRAALARERDRIYEDIVKLEGKEGELLAAGKAAASEVPRRRLAAQLAQLRKEISRHHTTAGMLNQQIDIISSNVHNLTLIQKGERAKLPTSEELTDNAVRAEELLETLQADVDLVSTLEHDQREASLSAEEQAILREFEAVERAPEPGRPEAVPPQQAMPTPAPPEPGERSASPRESEPGAAPPPLRQREPEEQA